MRTHQRTGRSPVSLSLSSSSRARARPGSRPRYVHRLWMLLFGVWAILLSGLFSEMTGSPGLLQAWRLQSYLEDRQALLRETETRIAELKKEVRLLEKDPATQQREIRQVLGYVAPGELIFDFDF